MTEIPVRFGDDAAQPPTPEPDAHTPVDQLSPEHRGPAEQALLDATAPLREGHDRLAQIATERPDLAPYTQMVTERPDLAARVMRLQTMRSSSAGKNARQERRDAKEAAERARIDPVTGLPNRQAFNEALSDEVTRHPQDVALLVADFDNFKRVNDKLGHAAGDRVLRAAAQRLAELVRPGDEACRVGGDELGVVMRRFEANVAEDRKKTGDQEPRSREEILEDRRQVIEDDVTETVRAEYAAISGDANDETVNSIGITISAGFPKPLEKPEDFYARIDGDLTKQKQVQRQSQQQAGFIPMIVMLVLLIILAIGLALWRVASA